MSRKTLRECTEVPMLLPSLAYQETSSLPMYHPGSKEREGETKSGQQISVEDW